MREDNRPNTMHNLRHLNRVSTGLSYLLQRDQVWGQPVFFTIETEGRSVPCYADLRQTVGSDYLKGDIEVAPPKTQKDEKPYRGPFNHEAFREQATAYYRAYVASGMIRFGPGVTNLRMHGNVFEIPRTITFEGGDPAGVW